MLRLSHNQHQLDIKSSYGRAWIEHYPKLGENLERLGELPDWRLWVEYHGEPSLAKSLTRVLIVSQLRAWILRHSKRGLVTLSFGELVLLAKGLPTPAPKRVHRSRLPADWKPRFRRP